MMPLISDPKFPYHHTVAYNNAIIRIDCDNGPIIFSATPEALRTLAKVVCTIADTTDKTNEFYLKLQEKGMA